MHEPADVARRGQRDAALRDELSSTDARLARVANELRADIAAGRMTRAEAVISLLSRERLTEYGAATVLGNDGAPGPVHIFGKSIIGQIGFAQLPPLITTEEN